MIAPTTRQATALALRRKGLTWQQIATEMKTNTRYAHRLADMAQIKEFRLQDAAKER